MERMAKLLNALAFASVAGLMSAAGSTWAQSYTVLHDLSDGSVLNDGAFPQTPPIIGPDGNFYGLTQAGGFALTSNPPGYGTAYRMTPDGKVTILHEFGDGSVPNDGTDPTPPHNLILGPDGNFYGITTHGGAANVGTIFRMSTGGKIEILHSFDDGTVQGDGYFPTGIMTTAKGQIFGATDTGTAPGVGGSGGVIWQISTSGVYTILTKDLPNGIGPMCLASDGNFYGITAGGTTGQGTITRVSPTGQVTVMHNFGDGSVKDDGAGPVDGPIQGTDGYLYGCTTNGGSTAVSGQEFSGYGVVYKMSLSGQVTILHSFGATPGDGKYPSEFTEGPDGYYYGTTFGAGYQDDDHPTGNLFRMTSTGTETILHEFGGSQDGAAPLAPLLLAGDGSFYSTTEFGGTAGDGVIYRLRPDYTLVAPTGLTATGLNQAVSLRWTSDSRPTAYTIYRGLNANDLAVVKRNVKGWQYVDTGLVNGTVYHYRILGTEGTAVSPPSNFAAGTPVAPGNRDLVILQNASSNQLALWHMDGYAVSSSAMISEIPTVGWSLVGCADFDGDGQPDLLFQEPSTGLLAVWYMDGPNRMSIANFPQSPSAAWHVVGVGDFNGDGHPDLCLQNVSTGQVAIWLLDGLTKIGGAVLPWTPAAGWSPVGVGDFNGDGYADILFQQTVGATASTDLAVWYMQGITRIGIGDFTRQAGPGRAVVAVDNLTAAVEPDIVLEDGSAAYEWNLSGLDTTSSDPLSSTVPSGWSVVGPR